MARSDLGYLDQQKVRNNWQSLYSFAGLCRILAPANREPGHFSEIQPSFTHSLLRVTGCGS